MVARAKFHVVAVTETVGGLTIKFEPSNDSPIRGSIELQIDNQAAFERFRVGGCYYVDFSAVRGIEGGTRGVAVT